MWIGRPGVTRLSLVRLEKSLRRAKRSRPLSTPQSISVTSKNDDETCRCSSKNERTSTTSCRSLPLSLHKNANGSRAEDSGLADHDIKDLLVAKTIFSSHVERSKRQHSLGFNTISNAFCSFALCCSFSLSWSSHDAAAHCTEQSLGRRHADPA